MSRISDLILSLHGWPALLIVFLLPALEASAFVGVVLPGEIAVILGGVLAFEHRVGLAAVLVAAIAGAVAGDTVGYLVGRRWGRRLLDHSIGRVVKREHLDRAQRYLAQRGGRSVLLGRWTAALRALIPGLAGMSGVHYRTFALYNLIGGALWATTFVMLGYASGAGWRQVESVAKRASLLLLVVVVVVWSCPGFPDSVRLAAELSREVRDGTYLPSRVPPGCGRAGALQRQDGHPGRPGARPQS